MVPYAWPRWDKGEYMKYALVRLVFWFGASLIIADTAHAAKNVLVMGGDQYCKRPDFNEAYKETYKEAIDTLSNRLGEIAKQQANSAFEFYPDRELCSSKIDGRWVVEEARMHDLVVALDIFADTEHLGSSIRVTVQVVGRVNSADTSQHMGTKSAEIQQDAGTDCRVDCVADIVKKSVLIKTDELGDDLAEVIFDQRKYEIEFRNLPSDKVYFVTRQLEFLGTVDKTSQGGNNVVYIVYSKLKSDDFQAGIERIRVLLSDNYDDNDVELTSHGSSFTITTPSTSGER